MTIAFGPVPRITWEHKEIHLVHFQEPKTFNYSTLLLSEDKDILYVGAREVIFALNSLNISEKKQEVLWKVTEDKKTKCAEKGKSKQTECLNYVRVLQQLNDTFLYVCGTNAFQPVCDYLYAQITLATKIVLLSSVQHDEHIPALWKAGALLTSKAHLTQALRLKVALYEISLVFVFPFVLGSSCQWHHNLTLAKVIEVIDPPVLSTNNHPVIVDAILHPSFRICPGAKLTGVCLAPMAPPYP
uniref:Uncharacterized protein n=1 Tax=Sphaerodactylus townsendi TaxID=933632 RepID=A0ACB8EQX6_9SAUR